MVHGSQSKIRKIALAEVVNRSDQEDEQSSGWRKDPRQAISGECSEVGKVKAQLERINSSLRPLSIRRRSLSASDAATAWSTTP